MAVHAQAVKHAEQEVAKEVQAVKDATAEGIHAAAATTGSQQPDKKDVEKLVEQIQTGSSNLAVQ